jgi:hypothetical protein
MSPEERAVATLMTILMTDDEVIKQSGSKAAIAAGVHDSKWIDEVWCDIIADKKLLRHSEGSERGWQITEAGLRFIESGGK